MEDSCHHPTSEYRTRPPGCLDTNLSVLLLVASQSYRVSNAAPSHIFHLHIGPKIVFQRYFKAFRWRTDSQIPAQFCIVPPFGDPAFQSWARSTTSSVSESLQIPSSSRSVAPSQTLLQRSGNFFSPEERLFLIYEVSFSNITLVHKSNRL